MTRDLDFVIELREENVELIVRAMSPDFYVYADDVSR